MFDQDSILSILFSRPNWICELFNLKYLKQIWPYISLLALPDVMLQVVILIVATKYAAKDTSLVTLSFSGDYFGDLRSWNLTFGWVGFGVLLYNVFFMAFEIVNPSNISLFSSAIQVCDCGLNLIFEGEHTHHNCWWNKMFFLPCQEIFLRYS